MTQDNLDQQIREALRVVPSPPQIARLEVFWQQQQRRADRQRRMRRGIALAASILIGITMSVWYSWQDPADPHAADQHPADQPRQARRAAPAAPRPAVPNNFEPIRSESSRTMIAVQPASEGRSSSAGRTPTALERFAFAVGASQPDTTKPRAPIASPIANLDRVIEQLRQDPAANIRPLAEVVRQTTDRHIRAVLIRRLLIADDRLALRGYLSLLYDETIRVEALAVAESLPQLPLAPLLALLDDGDKKVRLSAAMVLGRVNGPEITRSLISRVERKPSAPTEVWIALLTCRGPLAEEFISYAVYQPHFLGHVNGARAQLMRMIP